MPSATKKSKMPGKPASEAPLKAVENKLAGKSKQSKASNKELKPKMKAAAKQEAPPKKAATKKADKEFRIALGAGDISKDEVTRKKEQDARTLYVRFGDKSKLPASADEIKAIHAGIRFVRTPRMACKAGGTVRYAFVEFGSGEECKAAHKDLSTTQYKGKELVVDFVGDKSGNKKQKAQSGDQASTRLNPTRLFICGLAPGVTKTNLKEMFPKASHADIPQKSKKKGTSYGFVQFASPGDAKAAFDAAKDLTIADHKITVLFAKITETKPEVLQRKAEKRKARNDAKKKQGEEDEDQEEVKTEKKAEKRKAVKDEESANIKKGKTSETAKALKDEEKKEVEDDSEDEGSEDENDESEEEESVGEKEEEAGDESEDDEADDDDESEEEAEDTAAGGEEQNDTEDDDDDDDDDEDDE